MIITLTEKEMNDVRGGLIVYPHTAAENHATAEEKKSHAKWPEAGKAKRKM